MMMFLSFITKSQESYIFEKEIIKEIIINNLEIWYPYNYKDINSSTLHIISFKRYNNNVNIDLYECIYRFKDMGELLIYMLKEDSNYYYSDVGAIDFYDKKFVDCISNDSIKYLINSVEFMGDNGYTNDTIWFKPFEK